jgi:hypothetical protein
MFLGPKLLHLDLQNTSDDPDFPDMALSVEPLLLTRSKMGRCENVLGAAGPSCLFSTSAAMTVLMQSDACFRVWGLGFLDFIQQCRFGAVGCLF